MPYISEKIPLNKKYGLDRRIKIPKSEYPRIAKLWSMGYAKRAIARIYGVDHHLIMVILDPSKSSNYSGKWKKYYNKNKWRETMREHRAYKHKLYKSGLIGGDYIDL